MAHILKHAGGIITRDLGGKIVAEVGTLQCVHCGCHWLIQPGSGKTRGFCFRCGGPICGPGCAACVPQEQFLENLEQGRPLDHRRILVASGYEKVAA